MSSTRSDRGIMSAFQMTNPLPVGITAALTVRHLWRGLGVAGARLVSSAPM
jgi:hypothetical protein